MTLQNFTFFTVDRVYADPFIRQAASNETVLQDGMDRGR